MRQTTLSPESDMLPTPDEEMHDLNGATMFGKLDLNQGYHQLLLHPDSRHITKLSTHLWLIQVQVA